MSSTAAKQLIAAYSAQFLQPGAPAASPTAAGSLKDFVQDLAAKSTKPEQLLGDKKNETTVKEWLEKSEALFAGASSSSGEDEPTLKTLEKEIEPVVFLAPGSQEPSAADLSLFAYLHGIFSKAPAAKQHTFPSLTRYASYISQLPAVISASQQVSGGNAFQSFEPTYEGMPKIERLDLSKEKAKAKEAKKKAEGKADAPAAAAAEAASAAAGGKAAAEGKKEKKDKSAAPAAAAGGEAKPKKEKGGAGAGGKAPAAPSRPLPSQVDLRVGKIVDIKKHPDADALYLETVDFGEPEGPRTVLSGLVKYCTLEEMQGRMVVGICNLKPVAMRGIKSHAMLLCATNKEGAEKGGVEPVMPPEGSVPGDKLWVEGYEGKEPEAQLNPKKKIFESIQPGYLTTEDRQAAWRGVGPDEDPESGEAKVRLIRSEKGVAYAPRFVGATLS